MSLQTPLSVLLGRSLQMFGRRRGLYAAVTLAAVLAEASVALLWRPPHAALFAASVFMPLQSTVLYAFVAADSSAEAAAPRRAWARAFERAWAVLVIDFAGTALLFWGAAGAAGDALSPYRDLLAIVVVIGLVFAETAAVADDDRDDPNALMRTATLVPRSILRSVTLIVTGGFAVRALFLFALAFSTQVAAVLLGVALAHWHVTSVDFWTNCAIPTIVNAPLAVATMVFYVDAGDYESSFGPDADDEVAK